MLSTLAQSARRLFAPASSHIPGPRARYPGQHIVWLATDKLALFREMAAHGDITRIRIGPQPVVLVMHPDDIRKVLVTQQRNFHKGRATERTKLLMGQGLLTSEGEFHLRQRRLMQPAFHRERLATYANVMLEAAQHTGANWREGTNVDVHDAMMKLTLGVAGRTLFDADVDGNAHDVAEAMELSLRMFSYAILPLGALLEHAPIPWVRDLHRSRKRMDTFIYRMIDERRANGYHDRGDLMSMLLAARDAEGDGGGMDDVQLRNEVVTLLLAGHETTANWLTWTWYVLSRNPDVESRLHSELDRVLDGRAPTLSDVPRLEYLRRVLSESLRMYPPAWSLERRAIDDVQVGDHVIRKGTIVLTCQWLVHRDPRWWNEPERFDPDRWTPEAEALRPKFSYFPFGAGTRICIAEHFAWMEAMLVMATLAQHWRARYESSNAVIPEPLVTLRPKGGLRVRLERRSPATAA